MNERIASSEELKELGNKAFASKKFDEAIAYYSEALKIDPKNHVLYSNRSASYAGLGNFSKAGEDAKECIKLNPSFLKGYYRLTLSHIELHEFDKALSVIHQGLKIDPNHSQLSKQMKIVKQLKKQSDNRLPVSSIQRSTFPSSEHYAQLDEFSAKELHDLQMQFAQTNRDLSIVNSNLNFIQQEARMTELTMAELEPFKGTTRCYRQVGKGFLFSTKKGATEFLQSQIEERHKEKHDLLSKIDYLERRLKSQQQNIEEIVKPTRFKDSS